MKFQKFIVFTLFAFLLLNMQCDEDDVVLQSYCDSNIVIDNTTYQNIDSAFFSFINIEVDGDCLVVEISSSGCDGNTWVMELIDSEDVLESLPVQRNLKLALTNEEACLAVFSKTQTFDLTPIRVEGANEVILNIEDFPEPITYLY